MATDPRPIGVFDSGVGGLTVLRALRARLPAESTVYLGDTARVPYGTKSRDVVIRYALRNADFLMQRDIKLLVVACNTASAVSLPALTATLPIPVIGVIEPGAEAACAATRTGRVGVVGTPGTIASGAYQRAIEARRPGTFVWTKACPLFVPLAEEGWTDGEVPRLVAARYLQGIEETGIDSLVLGCTHYPLLRSVIAETLGETIQLIDSGEATAVRVEDRLLREDGIAAAPAGRAGGVEYFVTDVPASFGAVAERFLGTNVSSVEQVDIPV